MKVSPSLSPGASPLTLQYGILMYQEPMPDHPDLLRTIHNEQEFNDQTIGGRIVVSLHDIYEEHKTKRQFLGPGKPLDRSRFDSMIRRLADNGPKERELIPERLLCADASCLIWWKPPCEREIYFSTANKEFNAAVNGKRVSHPTLLFKATPNMLYVYALKDPYRPNVDTPIFVAPYYNLYANGSMCRGDVRLPSTILPSTIADWEKIFFDSRFTHSMFGRELTSFDGGLDALWSSLVGARIFDAKYLLPLKITATDQMVLGDLLK